MALDKKELGNKIKEARRLKSKKINKKYTGQNLADILGISRSYLGDIEAGRIYPSYRLLVSIANECDVPLSFFGDTDSLLYEIIFKTFPYMSIDEVKDFADYIKNTIISLNGIVDWDLDVWKDAYTDNVYNQKLINTDSDEDIYKFEQEYYNSEQEKYTNESTGKYNFLKIPKQFTNATDARNFVESFAIFGSNGFDPNKLNDEEILNFANELLEHMDTMKYKYKK